MNLAVCRWNALRASISEACSESKQATCCFGIGTKLGGRFIFGVDIQRSLDIVATMYASDKKPAFYEFFAGGGMARAGLEPEWRCLFDNDIDPVKGRAYVANWGGLEFHLGDIHQLKSRDLPGATDLAWMILM